MILGELLPGVHGAHPGDRVEWLRPGQKMQGAFSLQGCEPFTVPNSLATLTRRGDADEAARGYATATIGMVPLRALASWKHLWLQVKPTHKAQTMKIERDDIVGVCEENRMLLVDCSETTGATSRAKTSGHVNHPGGQRHFVLLRRVSERHRVAQPVA